MAFPNILLASQRLEQGRQDVKGGTADLGHWAKHCLTSSLPAMAVSAAATAVAACQPQKILNDGEIKWRDGRHGQWLAEAMKEGIKGIREIVVYRAMAGSGGASHRWGDRPRLSGLSHGAAWWKAWADLASTVSWKETCDILKSINNHYCGSSIPRRKQWQPSHQPSGDLASAHPADISYSADSAHS